MAQLLAVPQDGGDGGDEDPLAALKGDLGKARGKALLIETVAAGWGEGRSAAPARDWQQSRLGPAPTEHGVELARDAFDRVLAACGASPALFDDSDGTAKREALRQWHLGTVQPLARILERELSEKFAVPVRLRFDGYPRDMVSRAQVFAKLIAADGMTVERALSIAMLEDGERAA